MNSYLAKCLWWGTPSLATEQREPIVQQMCQSIQFRQQLGCPRQSKSHLRDTRHPIWIRHTISMVEVLTNAHVHTSSNPCCPNTVTFIVFRCLISANGMLFKYSQPPRDAYLTGLLNWPSQGSGCIEIISLTTQNYQYKWGGLELRVRGQGWSGM